MSRKGNCVDNAVAEWVFSSLKKERIKKQIYKNRERPLADVRLKVANERVTCVAEQTQPERD